MKNFASVIALLLLLVSHVSAKLTFAEAVAKQRDRTVHYVNSWAVRVSEGDEDADALASKHGLINRGQIGNQNQMYLFMEGEMAREVTKEAASLKIVSLRGDDKVDYVKQQILKARVKKDYTSPSDPDWNKQWSLENTGQYGTSGLDMNVEAVWMQGVTGRGVKVALVDDGMEWRHSDLRGNYDSYASHDFVHYDSDPTPDYNEDEPNSHGTECAGVVGMKENNICGVGVAYNASIASLKFDVGGSTDAIEASAVGYKDDYVNIYSNSWGPSDFGFIVDGPGPLLKSTLSTGVTQGRGGKGNIYVWAAGNGGRYYDSCSSDGYSSSIYTISVGSADQSGHQADYDEDCPAKMAVTFSYNSNSFPGEHDTFDPYNQVSTTTLDDQCTDGFTGTSASTPLVAGVIALVLQVNPDLTWRDVQYLLAYTANSDILTGDDWIINGAGLKVSHHFGFGAIDAEAMVTRARHWTNVPPQHSKTFYSSSGTVYSEITRTFLVSTSSFSSSSQISSLEHVVVVMSLTIGGIPYGSNFDYDDFFDELYYTYDDIYDWLQNPHARRGDIKIELTSPQGTKSILLPYRNYDFVNEEGYDNWPFMSVHFWGENPVGTWTLRIIYASRSGYVSMSSLGMTLYGTATVPTSVSTIPDTCHTSCARGCSAEGPDDCDSCAHYRIASNLTCVNQCPNNAHVYKNYCFLSSTTVSSSTTHVQTTTSSVSSQSSSSSTTSTTTSNLIQSTATSHIKRVSSSTTHVQTTTSSASSQSSSKRSSSTTSTTTSSLIQSTATSHITRVSSSTTHVQTTTSSASSQSSSKRSSSTTSTTTSSLIQSTATSHASSSVILQSDGRKSPSNNKTFVVAVAVAFGVVVTASAVIILLGVIYCVKIRRLKAAGFMRMSQIEDKDVET